jgi:glucose/mannose-6-phosphate isomerase
MVNPMRQLIAGLPGQLRWAADLEPPRAALAAEALVLGMGGSAFAGSVAALVAESAGRRATVHRSYGIPSWATTARPLAVAVSYSGGTRETLDGVKAAQAAGLNLAMVAAGGRLAELAAEQSYPIVSVDAPPPPRSAVGCLAGAVLRIFESAGLVPPQSAGLREAAEVVERLVGEGEGPAVALADDLAGALDHRVAVIYGAEGVGALAAYRWKTQINENGKAIAYCSVLPELDHNELEAWSTYPGISRDRVGVMWLRDPADDPRLARRADLTRDLLVGRVGTAGEVHAQGEGVLARLFSLVVVGDLLSVALAERAGVDPTTVKVIASLKDRLAGEGL